MSERLTALARGAKARRSREKPPDGYQNMLHVISIFTYHNISVLLILKTVF